MKDEGLKNQTNPFKIFNYQEEIMIQKVLLLIVLVIIFFTLTTLPSYARTNKLPIILSAKQLFTPSYQITTTIYLPIIYTSLTEPYPFDVSAQNIALQLSDMPFGYTIDSTETGPVETTIAIEGYTVQFENFDIILSGVPLVVNSTGIYSTPTLAANEIASDYQAALADPNYNFEPVSAPVFGDEIIAFKAYYQEFVVYVIEYRYGNLVSSVGTISLLGVTTIEDTLAFVELSLNRIESQLPR